MSCELATRARRAQTHDPIELARLKALMDAREKALQDAESAHQCTCRVLARFAEDAFAPGKGRVAAWRRKEGRERVRTLSGEEVQERAAIVAARSAADAAWHGWHRATFGRCCSARCGGALGPDGRCTVCPDACPCDGCSGAM